MADRGGFFKGEKKKKKKGDGVRPVTVAPVFTPPKVLPKGKEKE
jgi:hypothetical protein